MTRFRRALERFTFFLGASCVAVPFAYAIAKNTKAANPILMNKAECQAEPCISLIHPAKAKKLSEVTINRVGHENSGTSCCFIGAGFC